MVRSPRAANPGVEDIPFSLWPNLLSLDAPAIAIAWLMLFATSFRVRPGWPPVVALGLWVWVLYVADRVFDGMRRPSPGTATLRHRFYGRNRWQALIGVAVAATVATVISFGWIELAIRRAGIGLALLVGAYFVVTHMAIPTSRKYWPKELFVAILFAAGVCLPVWILLGAQRSRLFGPFILLAAVFWINALGIECWEKAPDRVSRSRLGSRTSRALALRLGPAAMGLAIVSGVLAVGSEAASIDLAIAMSALLLMALELNSARLRSSALRALADAALLTPILFLWPLR